MSVFLPFTWSRTECSDTTNGAGIEVDSKKVNTCCQLSYWSHRLEISSLLLLQSTSKESRCKLLGISMENFFPKVN